MQVGDKYYWRDPSHGTVYTVTDIDNKNVTISWEPKTSRFRTYGSHTYNISAFKERFIRIPNFKDYLCLL
mgnify:CR=1 FL=1